MLKIYLNLLFLLLIAIEIRTSIIDHQTNLKLKSNKIDLSPKIVENCSNDVKCVPKIQCPAHFYKKYDEKPQECALITGKPGYCCLTGQNHTTSNRQKRMISNFPQMENVYVEEAIAKLNSLINQHVAPIVGAQKPEFMHHLMFHSSAGGGIHSADRSKVAMKQILASQIYRDRHRVPAEAFLTGNVRANFHESPLADGCPQPVHCHNIHSKYRTFDGTCNNPHKPHWGAANQPMERLLPPAYEDGIWEPRRHSVDGSLLASAREISRILLPDVNRPHHKYNLMVMQFGQFIAHDVTHSASITLDNGEPIQCCTDDGSKILPPQSRHYACMPIPIDPNDEFYKKHNQGCINFVRLSLVSNQACRVGYGKQLSKVTHYLDGSVIYGSDLKTANDLRTFHGGKLRMSKSYAKDMLPIAKDRNHCKNIDKGNVCFESGDGRTNQLISLIVLHVIFAREHNRIANILSALNPHYDDEKLFQETRRIVVAEYQHIVYNEYLPLIIGTETMKRFGLFSKKNSYATDYNPEINAAITNAFTGSAFRFGHSTVDGKFKVKSEYGQEEEIEIPDVMFNPSRLLKRDFFDNMVDTLIEQPMQQVDNSITHGLSRFLFRGDNTFGLDLASLNIQRLRDQGMRPYNDYLELAGYNRIKSFNEFHPEVAKRLSLVYKHPDDIDMWLGGLLEPQIGDALVGPTFGEIIADQFSRFRKGDRYFYENDPKINPGHFRPDQLNAIRHTTLAGIICDNIDYFTTNEVPRWAFLRADLPGNEPIRCDSSSIKRINLNPWRE